MGQPLDAILKKVIDQNFTINSNYTSDSIDIDNREDEFAVQLTYDSGVSVDMTLSLEGSVNNVDFSQLTGSEQTITDPVGSHIWDVAGTGVSYLRVVVTVASGSIDVDKIVYSGKRRH